MKVQTFSRFFPRKRYAFCVGLSKFKFFSNAPYFFLIPSDIINVNTAGPSKKGKKAGTQKVYLLRGFSTIFCGVRLFSTAERKEVQHVRCFLK